MRKILLASAALVALSVSAQAQSLAIGGGFNFGNVTTGALTATQGLAAAGSQSAGINQSIGTGFAVASPLGTTAAGVGASVGQSASQSGAVSAFGGSAITGGFSNNIGVGVGGGFAAQN
jgi:hypothetical protein